MSVPENSGKSPTLAITMIVLSSFMLAGMDATGKYLALEVPIIAVIWGRYFFHTVITFSLYAGRTRSLKFLQSRRPGLQFIRAAAMFGATMTMYIAITRMQLAEATSIQSLAPVVVTALSGLLLGESVGRRRWTAVGFGFIGVLIVARPGSGVLGLDALLPLFTAVSLAIYMIMTRIIRTKDHTAATTFYTTAVGTVVLSLYMFFEWQSLTYSQWALMVTMGATGALGHFLLVRAFFMAEASILAPFTYTHVVGAIFWGFLVFGDVPTPWTIAGAIVVSGSGLYVWYRETRIRRT